MTLTSKLVLKFITQNNTPGPEYSMILMLLLVCLVFCFQSKFEKKKRKTVCDYVKKWVFSRVSNTHIIGPVGVFEVVPWPDPWPNTTCFFYILWPIATPDCSSFLCWMNTQLKVCVAFSSSVLSSLHTSRMKNISYSNQRVSVRLPQVIWIKHSRRYGDIIGALI